MKKRIQRSPSPLKEFPVWMQPEAPLGSAVRYVAGLSGKFQWVGIYLLRGKTLVLGPYLGAKTEHERIPVGKGICGTAVLEERDQNIADVHALSNYLTCSVETRSELVCLIRDLNGRIVGQIDIDSHFPAAFGPEEEAVVRRVADELGAHWKHVKKGTR